MTDFYTGLATTALNLITDKGQDVTINRYTSSRNVAKGRTDKTLSETDTLKVVVLPASKGTIQGFDNRAFSGLEQSKIRFMIAAASGAAFEPRVGDEITGLESASWRVLGSTPINPAGTSIVYRIGVAKV